MAAFKSSPRDRSKPQDSRRAATPRADVGKAKKRTPLRQVTAKKVKLPKDVPVGPKQIRHLRGLGHALNPVVHVGKAGITAELVASARAQLLAHELIKVKVSEEDRELRAEMANKLAAETGAVLAQVLGRTVLLYKRHPKNPKIVLPSGAAHVAANAADANPDDEDESDDDVEATDEEESDEEESDEEESDEEESDGDDEY